MSVATQLEQLEKDAQRGEKLRDKIGSQLADLNRQLANEVTDLVRVMFTSDKQLERALKKRLDDAAKSNKEFIFTQAGQKFKVGDIDPKRVAAQRELTSFEEEKLRKVRETLSEIEKHGKAALGAVRRERVLLGEFEKEARSAASELRSRVRQLRGNADTIEERREAEANVDELENDISEFEQRASRISAAESALEDVQRDAVKLITTAEKGQSLVKGVTSRRDLEDVLTAAAGGFGVSAAVAALVGSMGAAGILALPALVAFAASRLAKIVNDIRGKE